MQVNNQPEKAESSKLSTNIHENKYRNRAAILPKLN